MDGLKQYVISVVSSALICGILSGFFTNGAVKELIKMLCGLFLTVTLISPLSDLDFSLFTDSFLYNNQEATYAVAAGEHMAREAMADIIKSQTEAYILDKAASLNVTLDVEIKINSDNVPVEATIYGEISPYSRMRLENAIETDLGIAKENQLWTG